jgi:RNA-directed DNA polymerase
MVKKRLNGFAQLVRYADDFIVCFQYGDEARAFGVALEKRLAKFGLKISEEKSRIIEFGRYACQHARKQGKKCATFDFPGFTLYCDKTYTVKLAFTWVNRRSQKRSYNWEQFNRFLLFFI